MAISQNFPEEGPTLNLNFAGSRTLDPRITFTRTSSATYMGRDGLVKIAPANSARFDHRYVNGEIESLGLLVEEQSANLLFHSIVSTLTWGSIEGSTVTNNATTAPDGTNTAARVQVDTGGYVAVLNIPVTAGQPYTLSFWVKSVSGSSGTWGINIYDHGSNGFHNRTTRNITGEWTRISYTYTPVGNLINIYVSDDRSLLGTILDGYVWGAQLEQKSFATSYIPTEGSTATRTADNASIIGKNFSEWYRQGEGTVFVRYNIEGSFGVDGFNIVFEFSDGTSNNRFSLLSFETSDDMFEYWTINGTNQLDFNTVNTTFNRFYNWVAGYKENDFQRYSIDVDGILDSNTDTSISTSNFNFNQLGIGQDLFPVRKLNGHISHLTYFPKRLPNSILQTLTR